MADNTVTTFYNAKGNHAKVVGGIIKQNKSLVAGLSVATAGVVAFGVGMSAVVKTGKEFEKTMSGIKAILQPTGAGFEALEAQARALGATTAFTATQAGEAFTELGKLGFDTNEIIASSADVLNLAAAASTDMATAAAATAKTLNQFNLEATDAAHITDVIAKASSSSAIDIYNFQEAMKIAGGVASGFGVSVEDATATISALADAGLEGTIAGTGLSRMLVEMGKTGSKANKLLVSLNAENGTFVEKLEAISKEGLTTGEIITTFGQIAGKSAIAVLNNTDKVKELADAYRDAGGAADKMAKDQLDNLDGGLRQLESAAADLKIELFETFSPALTAAVNLGTKALLKYREAMTGQTADEAALAKKEALVTEERAKNWNQTVESLARVGNALSDYERGAFGASEALRELLPAELTHNKSVAEFIKETGTSAKLIFTEMIPALKAKNKEEADATKAVQAAETAEKDRTQAVLELLRQERSQRGFILAVREKHREQIEENGKLELKWAKEKQDSLAKTSELEADTLEQGWQRADEVAESRNMRLLGDAEFAIKVEREKWDDIITLQGLTFGIGSEQQIAAVTEKNAVIKTLEEEASEDRKNIALAEFQQRVDLAQQFTSVTANISSAVTAIATRRIDNETDAQIKAVNASTKSEEEKEKEIIKIQEKAAQKRKKIALAEWATRLTMSIVDTAAGAAKTVGQTGVGAAFAMPLVIAAGVAQTAIIAANMPKMARGGILGGASHAGGGIPTQFGELEGGEAVINKRSTALFKDELSAINQAGGGRGFGGGTTNNSGGNVNVTMNITASGGADALASIEEATPQMRAMVVSALSTAQQNGEIDTSIINVGA